jgi:uridine kinase
MLDVDGMAAVVLAARSRVPRARSLLVAITGIDASGKGYAAARLHQALAARGLRPAILHADDWLELPSVRLGGPDPAALFYRRAIRFEAMFAQLVLPLRDRRAVRLEAERLTETSTAFARHTYIFEDVDVVLLEGIFLLQRALRHHYDLSFWIDCSFETALERALERRQEGLPLVETVRAYDTIYFPAQRLHLQSDAPRRAASTIFANDPRLAPTWR